MNDLMRFWARHQNGRHAKDLFPKGGKGTRTATGDLANYAANLHAVRHCQEHEDPVGTQIYEKILENIKAKLPDGAINLLP